MHVPCSSLLYNLFICNLIGIRGVCKGRYRGLPYGGEGGERDGERDGERGGEVAKIRLPFRGYWEGQGGQEEERQE